MAQNERDARRIERNNIRKLLWQWGNTIDKIKRLEKERMFYIGQADDRRITLRSPSLTGMPRSGKNSDLSDVIVGVQREQEMYEQQAERINAEIADALRLRNCMQQCIDRLTPVQEKIIAYRYADGHSWRYIAMKLNYDEASARRIENQALDAIMDMIQVTAE